MILELVAAHGRMRVRDLAAMVGVTEPTIRKDVADLDRARLLRRTHGGVIAIQPSYEPAVTERAETNAAGKEAIARACLTEIVDGDAIFLDSGTTTAAIARALRDVPARVDGIHVPVNVNVLTNAVDVATTLADAPSVRHTVLGGVYRPLGGCFVGALATSNIEQFSLNTAFIGVSGVNEVGLTVADLAEAQVKQAVMNHARRVIVPMDHTKVGASDFVKICDLDRIDAVITDQDNPHLRSVCDKNGLRYIVAD
jgi:DeoR/GlpR family transcriptional regulator of sugar metabolism